MREDTLETGVVPALLDLFTAAGTHLSRPILLARRVDGMVVGGFAWTDYSGDTIQMHYVGAHKHWMNRQLLEVGFRYAFETAGVKCILAFLPPDRLHAKHVAMKLGFREMGIIPGCGIHMLTMTRDDCRWLALSSRGGNGKQCRWTR